MTSFCIRNPLDDSENVHDVSSSSSISEDTEFQALALVVFQCVANYLQSYELSNHVWRQLYLTNKVVDMVMIAVKCRSRKHLSVVFNILYNCIRYEHVYVQMGGLLEKEEKRTEELKLEEFIRNRPLLCQLLLSVVDCCEVGSQGQLSSAFLHGNGTSCHLLDTGHTQEEKVDPVMSWMYLLLELLIKCGKLSQLFVVVGPTCDGYSEAQTTTSLKLLSTQLVIEELKQTKSKCRVSCEQLILMNCIFDIFDDESFTYTSHLKHELSTITSQDDMDLKVEASNCSKNCCRDLWMLVHVLATYLDTGIDKMDKGWNDENRKEDEGGGDDRRDDLFDKQLINSSVLNLMRLLSTIMIQFYSQGKTLLGRKIRKSLMISTPTLIRKVISLLPRDAAITRSNSASKGNTAPHMHVHVDIVKSSLRLVATMIYDCRDLQNELRVCGGLAVVLSHCGTDFSNPLSREWALFCVKNACENNEENVNFIDSLKPARVFQHVALESRGIEVNLDADGKLKFNNTGNTYNSDSDTDCFPSDER